MKPGKYLAAIIAMLLMAPVLSHAEVTDSSYYGFTVKSTVIIHNVKDTVYKDFIEIRNWWNPAHTYSGSSLNLVLQSKANGCFCEKLDSGGSVRHMTVDYAQPGKIFRMSGAIGPLQELPVNGVMTVTFQKSADGTEVTMIYRVGGNTPQGLARFAGIVDMVLREQLDRLKEYAEKKNN